MSSYSLEICSRNCLCFLRWVQVIDLKGRMLNAPIPYWLSLSCSSHSWMKPHYLFWLPLIQDQLFIFSWPFDKQIQSLEESAEVLRERCLKFHKGCRKYTWVFIWNSLIFCSLYLTHVWLSTSTVIHYPHNIKTSIWTHSTYVSDVYTLIHTPVICFSEGLGEAYDGDIAFASALETFGGGHNDPISVAFGGESC